MDGSPRSRAPEARAWRAELAATLALGWPLAITNVAQIALAVTDVLLIGRLGAHHLSAAALATNLYIALMVFGSATLGAVAPLVARAVGAGGPTTGREVRRTVAQGVWCAALLAIPIWLVLWQSETLLGWLGQDAELSREATRYMHALQWALLPSFLCIVLRSLIAALERPRAALVVSLAGIALNALAGWLLIFGHAGFPALGIVGAGIATTLANGAMAAGLVGAIALDRKLRRFRVFGRLARPDVARLRDILRLGLPIGLTATFEVTVFCAAAFLMGLIGRDALAAHTIAIQIASTAFMVPLSIGQAATVRVALAYGAGDPAGMRRAGWTSYALGVGFMACTAALMLAAPHLLIDAFLDAADPANGEVVRLAAVFLTYAGLFQLVDGAQVVGAGMLRGLHDTRIPMIFAAIGYWGLALPLAGALGFATGLGGAGIWIGLSAGLAAVALMMTLRWARREALGLVSPAVPERTA